MELLNLLTPPTLGPALTYEAYVERFQSDPGQLFPSRLATTARARAVSSESPAPLVEVPAAVALDSLVDTHFHGRIEKDERTVTLTTSPAVTWTEETAPACSARTGISIFIDSSSTTVSPTATWSPG